MCLTVTVTVTVTVIVTVRAAVLLNADVNLTDILHVQGVELLTHQGSLTKEGVEVGENEY